MFMLCSCGLKNKPEVKMELEDTSFVSSQFNMVSQFKTPALQKEEEKERSITDTFVLRIASQLKKRILEGYKNDSVTIDENCSYQVWSGVKHFLSCISIDPKYWEDDIDRDGETDLILSVINEGCGGGGNMVAEVFDVVYLRNKQIYKIEHIQAECGGYAHLKIDSIVGGVFYTSFENSWSSLGDRSVESIPNKPHLQFEWIDGRIVEKSYEKCKLFNLSKKIFLDSVKNVKRNISMNYLYEEEQNETLKPDSMTVIYGDISGCQSEELSFYIDIPYDKRFKSNLKYKTKFALQMLEFLKQNTFHAERINQAIEHIKENGLKDSKIIKRPNDLSYRVYFSNYEPTQTRLVFNFYSDYRNAPSSDFRKTIKKRF